MGAPCCFHIIFGLLFSMDYLLQSAATEKSLTSPTTEDSICITDQRWCLKNFRRLNASCTNTHLFIPLQSNATIYETIAGKEYLPPPTNITFRMEEMFAIVWSWKPPIENCTCQYWLQMSTLSNGHTKLGCGQMLTWRVDIAGFDLNGNISFNIQAKCNNKTSQWVNFCAQLAPGNERTSVRNFSCVWYYMDYVNCTWQPGQDTPPNVNYSLLYWVENYHFALKKEQTDFQHLLGTGTHCKRYFRNNGLHLGCLFELQKTISDLSKLRMVVTDRLNSIKPFIFQKEANDIVKLRPPTITKVHRNQSIYVQWNISQDVRKLVYEVAFKMSSSEKEDLFEVDDGFDKELPNALPDVTYTVKVRVKLSPHMVMDKEWLWSDWSEEKTLTGKDNGTTTSIILLILIPCILVVTVIILLIFMRRLKSLIFPEIPDPGRIFQNDLQQWLKNDRKNVYNKPEREDICPVSLLDN